MYKYQNNVSNIQSVSEMSVHPPTSFFINWYALVMFILINKHYYYPNNNCYYSLWFLLLVSIKHFLCSELNPQNKVPVYPDWCDSTPPRRQGAIRPTHPIAVAEVESRECDSATCVWLCCWHFKGFICYRWVSLSFYHINTFHRLRDLLAARR